MFIGAFEYFPRNLVDFELSMCQVVLIQVAGAGMSTLNGVQESRPAKMSTTSDLRGLGFWRKRFLV